MNERRMERRMQCNDLTFLLLNHFDSIYIQEQQKKNPFAERMMWNMRSSFDWNNKLIQIASTKTVQIDSLFFQKIN